MKNLTEYKRNIKLYAIGLAVLAFFFVPAMARAFNPQPDQFQVASAISSTMSANPILQTFFPEKSNIAGMFTTQVITSTSSVSIVYFVCRGVPDLANLATTYNCGNDGNILIDTGIATDLFPNDTTKNIFFQLEPPYPNFGNFSYYVSFVPTGGNARFIFAPYAAGSWSNINQRGYGTGIPAGYSMYFIEFYDADDNNKIFLIDPLNGVYNNEILQNFNLAINVPANNLDDTFLINIEYGTSSNYFAYSDNLSINFFNSGWQEIGIQKTNELANGLYYWRATAYIENSIYGTSTIENFEIDNLASLGELSEFQIPTEEEICAGVDTSSFFGAIECALKKVFVWAFYPSNASIKKISDKTEAIKKDFPFNILFDTYETIDTAIASTTYQNSGFSIPFIEKTATGSDFILLEVATASTLPAIIGEDNNQLFRNSIIWIFALFLVAIIYLQLR